MRSYDSYQDIETPEEIEEEFAFESELDSLLAEYDPAEAGNCSFQQYRLTCIRRLREKQLRNRR